MLTGIKVFSKEHIENVIDVNRKTFSTKVTLQDTPTNSFDKIDFGRNFSQRCKVFPRWKLFCAPEGFHRVGKFSVFFGVSHRMSTRFS